MTVQEVMIQLENLGDTATKVTLMKHGAKEPLFGVKVGDLKKIVVKIKKDHDLSLALYKTGNSDAMYLAGLIADENKITRNDLQDWVEQAYWYYLSEYTVPWVAGETAFGLELGKKWITSEKENIACAGWSTLAAYASVREDESLDLNEYIQFLNLAENTIHHAPDRVKQAINSFVISIGLYIAPLTNKTLETANNIGTVQVEMNGTRCKIPSATAYINKNVSNGRVGKKRKTARC